MQVKAKTIVRRLKISLNVNWGGNCNKPNQLGRPATMGIWITLCIYFANCSTLRRCLALSCQGASGNCVVQVKGALFPECYCLSLHLNRAWLKVLRYHAPVGFRLSFLSRPWEGTFVLLTSRTKTWPHAYEDCQSGTYLMAYFMCN